MENNLDTHATDDLDQMGVPVLCNYGLEAGVYRGRDGALFCALDVDKDCRSAFRAIGWPLRSNRWLHVTVLYDVDGAFGAILDLAIARLNAMLHCEFCFSLTFL